MFTIIRDTAKLNRAMNAMVRTQRALNRAVHEVGVSVLVHTAEHRNPVMLNRFFEALNPNDKSAFRNYVLKFQHVFTPRLDDEGNIRLVFRKTADGKGLEPSDKRFLRYSTRKGWEVIKLSEDANSIENANRFVLFAEQHLINPAPEKNGPVKGAILWHEFFKGDAVRDTGDRNSQFLTGQQVARVLKGLSDKLANPTVGIKGLPAKAAAEMEKHFASVIDMISQTDENEILRKPVAETTATEEIEGLNETAADMSYIRSHEAAEAEEEKAEAEEAPAPVPPVKESAAPRRVARH